MEIFDVIVLFVLGGATLFGLMKGFAWQVASLLSLVLSYVLAFKFSDALAPQLNADPRYAKYLAMLVLYCGTSLAVWLGFRVVSQAINQIHLKEFDRQMGGLFGFAKGVLLCLIITFFAVTLSEQSRAAVLRSKSGVYISRFLHAATPVIPPEYREQIGPVLTKLDRGLDPRQAVEYPQFPNMPNLPNIGDQTLPGTSLPGGYNTQPAYPQYQQNVPAGGYAPPQQPLGTGPYAPQNPYNSGTYPNGAPLNR